MIDGLTMACINLHSVLRNLEDLCELDEEAKALIKGKNITILFQQKMYQRQLFPLKMENVLCEEESMNPMTLNSISNHQIISIK
ncbi:MAG: hypothetical protein GX787_03715 [Tissierellia bacterium]|nr:hypothetical protein [Tissierellia bacterium]